MVKSLLLGSYIFFSSIIWAQDVDVVTPPLCSNYDNVKNLYKKIQISLLNYEAEGYLKIEDITTLRLALDGLYQKSVAIPDESFRCFIYNSSLQSIDISMNRLQKSPLNQ